MKPTPTMSQKESPQDSSKDPLAHVPVADLTKLPPADVQAEREALEAISRVAQRRAKAQSQAEKAHLN